MGFLKNLKQGIDAAKNPPTPEQIEESLKYLSPEQRAAYDAQMARVAEAQAEGQASYQQARAINDEARILEGPAGDHVYGKGMASMPSPDDANAAYAAGGIGGLLKQQREASKGEFKKALRQTIGRDEVAQEKDPAERERIAGEERAARQAARAPYLAPGAAPVAISRISTRGATQVAEVSAWLEQSGLASRPDLVFGVYRVPDRISPGLTPQSEKHRVVEWDVVHVAGAATGVPAPAGTVSAALFAADQQWVARRVGEPSILDEDLAAHYLQRAGIGPQRVLGVARLLRFEAPSRTGWNEEESPPLRTRIDGVLAFHVGDAGQAVEAMAAESPLRLPPGDAPGTHVEVLNWGEVARAVHTKAQKAHLVPSPFPYLPSTPQELLRAYLEVVGVAPADTWSVQATVNWEAELIGQMGMGSTNLGPKQPCADGKERRRLHGTRQVVVAHLDRPEHVAGRERWAAYQRDVLLAGLHKGNRLRPELVDADDVSDISNGLLRAGARFLNATDRLGDIGSERRVPYRYCWPPVR